MSVQITKLHIKDFQQFKDLAIDFTETGTGKPLKKVCLIGGNGTGKSTILRILASAQVGVNCLNYEQLHGLTTEEIVVNYHSQDKPLSLTISGFHYPSMDIAGASSILDTLAIYSPSDSETLANFNESALLNDSLNLLKSGNIKYDLSNNLVQTFWQHLTALIKRRESDLITFQKLTENRNRTIADIEEEFDDKHPEILAELAEIWNPILNGVDLEFDYESASIPVMLTDKLDAHIKSLNNSENIPYSALSSGIKNFILRLGLIFTISRLHSDKQGVIFIDEPENSLHPDFLMDIISYYEKVAPNCQLFFATHSPIVAAQFKPEERFILEYDHENGVTSHKGISPEGDDPNDILTKDFAVRSLYGEEGLKNWNRFKELERIISAEEDKTKKIALLREYLDIGHSYNFPTENEISA